MLSKKNLPLLDWLQIESSAPGKFIISGEYSVVYEKQAVAAAIDLRTRVTIFPNTEGLVRLNLLNVNMKREWPTSDLTAHKLITKYSECLEYNETMPAKLNNLLNGKYCVDLKSSKVPTTVTDSDGDTERQVYEIDIPDHSVRAGVEECNDGSMRKKADDAVLAFLLIYLGLGDSYSSSARPPINVEVESSIPVGSGLGSSSAYSVALCGALMRVFRVAAEKYIISNWAFQIDRFFHGRPSGVDNNIVSVGGYILFQNSKIKTHGVAHNSTIKVMLIDTCVSRSTKDLSEMVAAKMRDDPTYINTLFTTINDLTTQIWRKMNDAEFTPKNISNQLATNQHYLNSLGVGHEKLNDICMKAGQLGFTAKQTGAGGGGTAFILYSESDDRQNVEQLKTMLVKSGYIVHEHSMGCEGLTVKVVLDPQKKFGISNE